MIIKGELKQTVILFFFLVNSIHGLSQNKLIDVNLNLIKHKKVRRFICHQQEENIESFYDIHPTLLKDQIPLDFKRQDITYTVKEDINTVWNYYLTISPAESWDGKRVSFGVLFSKNPEQIIYSGGRFSAIDTGQVIYLNLKILKGIYNLALAFEIISIDVKNKIIEFSYIEGNKSRGKQRLQFFKTDNGRTKIIHSSFFKSDSKIRDRILYPFFHKRATNEFHKNMRRIIKSNNNTS